MLYFICFPNAGFVVNKKGICSTNVREALPFTSFKEADDLARALVDGKIAYAILSNCVG